MFRSLLRNTVVTGAAFVVVGALNVLLTPILIQAYGLRLFGLITLSRMFLPTGFLSILDFGLSETATQIVARVRSGADKHVASQQLSFLAVLAAVLGVLVGITLWVLSSFLPQAFRVEPADEASFKAIICVTALISPLLFVALVFEGAIKGLERYATIRATEVLSTVVFVAGSAWFAVHAVPYWWIVLLFFATTLGRYIVLSAVSISWLRVLELRRSWWQAEAAQFVWRRSVVMLQGRVLGTVQNQSPPLIIALLAGPAAVGLYDVLMRLPRFAKVTLGLLNTALLPATARLDHAQDTQTLQRLGRLGLTALPLMTIPLLTSAAVFSEETLKLWIGGPIVSSWPWMAIGYALPLFQNQLGFAQTMLLVHPTVIAALNRLLAIQVIMMVGISLLLFPLWHERAFIAGQVLAAAMTYPFQMSVALAEQKLPRQLFLRLFGGIIIFAVLLCVPTFELKNLGLTSTWPGLVLIAALWVGCLVAAAYVILLTRQDKVEIRRIVALAFGH